MIVMLESGFKSEILKLEVKVNMMIKSLHLQIYATHHPVSVTVLSQDTAV